MLIVTIPKTGTIPSVRPQVIDTVAEADTIQVRDIIAGAGNENSSRTNQK